MNGNHIPAVRVNGSPEAGGNQGGNMGGLKKSGLNQLRRGKCARQDFEARTAQIRATRRLTTKRLQAQVARRPLKAILESGANLQVLKENPGRTAIADAACRILLERMFRNMSRHGFGIQTCLACPVFAILTFEDAEGCPLAGQASCRGKQRKVRSARGGC